MWGPPGHGGGGFPFNDDIFEEMEKMLQNFENIHFNFSDSTQADEFSNENARPKSLRDGIIAPGRENVPDKRRSNSEDDAFSSKDNFNRRNFFSNRGLESWIDNLFNPSFHQFSEPSPLPRLDIDLDSKIAQDGLKSVLQNYSLPSTKPENRDLWNFQGFFRSQSTIRSADGTVEKRVTEKDSSGNEITTVTIERPDGSIDVKKYENNDIISSSQNLHDSIIDDKSNPGVLPYSDQDERFSVNSSPSFRPFSGLSSITSALFDLFKGSDK